MAGIESDREQNFRIGLIFDNYLQITQLPAKAPGELVEDARHFFSEFVVIQQP